MRTLKMAVFDVIQTKELNAGGNIHTVGRNGRPSYFQAIVHVKVGDYFNAAKSELTFGAAGGVNGMASAHNCE